MPTEWQPGLIVFIYPKVHRFNLTEMVVSLTLTYGRGKSRGWRAIGYDNPLLPSPSENSILTNMIIPQRSVADGIVPSDLIRVEWIL